MEANPTHRIRVRDLQLLADKNSELSYLRRLADKQANRLRALEETLSRRGPPKLGPLPAQYRQTNPLERLKAVLGSRAGSYFPLVRPEKYPLALRARPGKTGHELLGRRTATIGIGVFDLTSLELAAVVDAVRRSQRRPPHYIPVFLTDSTDTTEFRVEGFVFEYFPNRDLRQRAPDRNDVDLYFLDKLRFVLMKWGVTEVICFGNDNFPPDGAA